MHRQPPVIAFTVALVSAATGAFGENPDVQAERELTAAKATESLLRTKGSTAAELQKMETIYRDLAARHPRDVRVLNACGSFLWDAGKLEQAEDLFRKALALAPENPDTLSSLGAAALSAGEVRKAANLYTKACIAAPDSAPLHFNLANVLFLFRHELLDTALPDENSIMVKAMGHYAEACRLAPESVDYARGRAETFYSLLKPDWEAALEAWQHLHRISPHKDFALANMATVHLKLGQKEQARECVRQMNSPEFAGRKARLMKRIEKE